MRRHRGRGNDRGQRGQGMVELAIILPLLLTVLLGTIDLGRAFYTYVALTNAAREAARYAAVNDTNASITQVRQEFTAGSADLSGCAAGSLTFAASGGGRGNAYTVNVGCRFTLITPFIAAVVGATGNQLTIRSTATFVWD